MRNVNAKIFLKTTAPITYIILLIFWIVTACNKDPPQTPDPIGSWTRMMEFDTGTWQVGLTLSSTGILRWEPIDSIPGHTASEVSYELNASGFRILNDSKCNTEAQYEFELTQDLLESGSYTFLSSVNDSSERFVLHFKPLGLTENTRTLPIQVWSSDNRLLLQNPDRCTGVVEVFNVYGQKVERSLLTPATAQQIPLQITAGYYVVSIVTAKGIKNELIYID